MRRFNKIKKAPKGGLFLAVLPFGEYEKKGGKYAWEFYSR
jgi:hypothetical protein